VWLLVLGAKNPNGRVAVPLVVSWGRNGCGSENPQSSRSGQGTLVLYFSKDTLQSRLPKVDLGFFLFKGEGAAPTGKERESLCVVVEEGRPNGQGGCGGLLNVFFQKRGGGCGSGRKSLGLGLGFFFCFPPHFLRASPPKFSSVNQVSSPLFFHCSMVFIGEVLLGF
jgi:hypothetical protein